MSEIIIKITSSHTARLTTRTVLERVRAAVPELKVELVYASHFMENGICISKTGESETQKVCPRRKGKGSIETYFDAGDHFSMGSSPFSGWEKSKCTRCNGTGRVTG